MEEVEKPKRKRRTKAEMEASRAAEIERSEDVGDADVVDMEEHAGPLSPKELEAQARANFASESEVCAHLARILPSHDTASLREIESHIETDCHADGYEAFLAYCRSVVAEIAESHRAACSIDPHLAMAIAYSVKHDPPALTEAAASAIINGALPDGFRDPAPVPIGNSGATIIEWYDGIEVKPGHFYEGMPNEVYHSLPGISKSGLDRLDRSPAHYRYPAPREATRYMDIGSAIHAALLEPDRFKSEYLILEGVDSRVRTEYKQAIKHRPDETTLTEKEGVKVLGMQQAAYDDPNVSKYLRAINYTELSGIAGDPERPEEWRRIRIDGYINAGGRHIVLDLKKTQDAREEAFMRSLTNYRYHVQAAFYSDVFAEITGDQLSAFVFLALEEEQPHGCRLYVLEDEALQFGLKEAKDGYARYIECVRADEWPCYDSQPTTINLTAWALKQAREDQEDVSDD